MFCDDLGGALPALFTLLCNLCFASRCAFLGWLFGPKVCQNVAPSHCKILAERRLDWTIREFIWFGGYGQDVRKFVWFGDSQDIRKLSMVW